MTTTYDFGCTTTTTTTTNHHHKPSCPVRAHLFLASSSSGALESGMVVLLVVIDLLHIVLNAAMPMINDLTPCVYFSPFSHHTRSNTHA